MGSLLAGMESNHGCQWQGNAIPYTYKLVDGKIERQVLLLPFIRVGIRTFSY
ncbi:hypothetical protein [Winogradskyella schleiferi]|uniref:hypothetical protein n=1 Tax=Winogradskyella schleiferi TaxID=2686078 RepID=UPI0015BD9AB2|nr:hypothetical protein [Winogradskyella schleiferi]